MDVDSIDEEIVQMRVWFWWCGVYAAAAPLVSYTRIMAKRTLRDKKTLVSELLLSRRLCSLVNGKCAPNKEIKCVSGTSRNRQVCWPGV
jgi:hypothetical protein